MLEVVEEAAAAATATAAKAIADCNTLLVQFFVISDEDAVTLLVDNPNVLHDGNIILGELVVSFFGTSIEQLNREVGSDCCCNCLFNEFDEDKTARCPKGARFKQPVERLPLLPLVDVYPECC
ncbi:unnamed protein product [Schistosoma margrebowiei]|uniref:Uncharacterized protein n=1 Tax=Schistosoma margrebowiei TaxID=48269 RepID=A0A183LAQ1_9TREM|nr:unnamed protein product [Schistosoma margrebowiei]